MLVGGKVVVVGTALVVGTAVVGAAMVVAGRGDEVGAAAVVVGCAVVVVGSAVLVGGSGEETGGSAAAEETAVTLAKLWLPQQAQLMSCVHLNAEWKVQGQVLGPLYV